MYFKTVKPFLKWAGGKSQLLPEIRKHYPAEIRKYCEPFVGGGAVLFDVLANFHPTQVLINDRNPQLINVYLQIRDNVDDLIQRLSALQQTYDRMNSEERKICYYQQREAFNTGMQRGDKTPAEMACLFLFLNKTCYNGLYRVNRDGLFNVPAGRYKHPVFCDAEHFREISLLLQGVQITCGDYAGTRQFIIRRTPSPAHLSTLIRPTDR